MNTIKTIGLTAIATLAITACGGGGDTPETTPETTQNKSVTVKNSDGTIFGVTRAEDAIVNGGVPIYNMGTGEQIGFIQVDGSTNNLGGEDLGNCEGAVDSNGDFTSECTLPTPTSNTPTSNTPTSNTPTSNTPTSNIDTTIDTTLPNPETDPSAVLTGTGSLIGQDPDAPTVLVPA